MDYNKIAKDIIDGVGGASNVSGLTHCLTRLRFVLKNSKKADKEVISHLEGVISVVESGGQFQVVVGTKVEKIYDEMLSMVSIKEDGENDKLKKGSIWNRILVAITTIFTPMIPAIAASGLLKGILTVVKIIAASKGGDITTNQTYTIILAATDSIFYFMPIILAYTSAKVFKANEFIAMALGGTMCYPVVTALMTESAAVKMFGIEITKASYASSVIPIIIGVFILSYIQRFLEKYIPEVLKIILVPGISLMIMVPAVFMIFGPIGIYIGNIINFLYSGMMGLSPILCGAFIGGMWCVFVIFGAHRVLLPIGINDVALFGRQNLLAFAGAANFSQGGSALGVMLKTKNKNLKTIAASATISAVMCGITEPAIYGCNLRLKKPMIYAVICGAIGGAVMGAGGVYGDAFANNGVLTLATYAAFGVKKFIFYLIGVGVAFFGAAILTFLFGFDDIIDNKKEDESQFIEDADITINSPLEGISIPLNQVTDQVFSSGALGKGVAVIPEKGEVAAPDDCTVSSIYPTLHAVGLTLDNGAELIIHIGMDTVNLQGKYFEKYVKEGQHVKKGTKLISFDLEAIKREGYDVITPVIVSNTADYARISAMIGKKADINEAVIAIQKNK